MFKTVHRHLSSPLRSSARRANLNAAASLPRVALTLRMMSSESHASHGSTSNDRPWIIGSALVFGPLFLYLVSPSARKGSHGDTSHGHKSQHGEHADQHSSQHVESHREMDVKPVSDDEGTEVSGQEVKESMEKAFNADSPKDTKEREVVVAETETTTVEEKSAIEAQPESPTDAMPTESQPDSTPVTPVGVDEAANATSDEKARGDASNANELTAESKA